MNNQSLRHSPPTPVLYQHIKRGRVLNDMDDEEENYSTFPQTSFTSSSSTRGLFHNSKLYDTPSDGNDDNYLFNYQSIKSVSIY